MSAQEPRKQFDWLQTFVQRHRLVILLIVFFLLIMGTSVEIVGNHYCGGNKKPSLCAIANDLPVGLSSLGTLIMFLQLILTFPRTSLSASIQDIANNKTVPRNIIGQPLLTDSRTVEQRKDIVEEIYAMLTQPAMSAVVLTGITGVGKSTLASLLHDFVERRYHLNRETFFNAEPLWLNIDKNVSMAELINTLFKILKEPFLNLDQLTPQNQAAVLFNVLNKANDSRLIILNQFDNLLDGQTGYVLANQPGVGEWLDAINCHPCRCRFLLTSRFFPKGTREYAPTNLKEYYVKGLEDNEGVQLLRKYGVEMREDVLRRVVKNDDGHAAMLKEIATRLRIDSNLSSAISDPLTDEDETYVQLRRSIAYNLLKISYKEELNEIERELLIAFSIYRKPEKLEAVQFLINLHRKVSMNSLRPPLEVLLAHHLLHARGEFRYQLHPVAVNYAQGLLNEINENISPNMIYEMHASAAQYYLQIPHLTRGYRQNIGDMHPLIEVSWQYLQAHEWKQAYDFMYNEGVFTDLRVLKANATLLELCHMFLPLENWQPNNSQASLLIRTMKEISSELEKKHLEQYYDDILKRWLSR